MGKSNTPQASHAMHTRWTSWPALFCSKCSMEVDCCQGSPLTYPDYYYYYYLQVVIHCVMWRGVGALRPVACWAWTFLTSFQTRWVVFFFNGFASSWSCDKLIATSCMLHLDLPDQLPDSLSIPLLFLLCHVMK